MPTPAIVLVGLNNPYSEDPRHALAPFPEGSAGNRLYTMMDNVHPISRSTYMMLFSRQNLINSRTPPRFSEVRRIGQGHWFAPGLRVVLLGVDVLRALRTPDRPLEKILIHPQVYGGVTFRWLPHPSGRSTVYNDPVVRYLAGKMLIDLINH